MDNDSSWDETGWDSDPALDSEDEHQIGDSWLDRIFNKKHREETLDDQINAARDRVANYYSSGQADQHRERLAADDHYRETLEYAIAAETEHLERHIQHYDEEMGTYQPQSQFLMEDTWGHRIGCLNEALAKAEQTLSVIREKEQALSDRGQRGELSQTAQDDLWQILYREEQRAISRLSIGGLGGSYEDIGEVSDQAGHIIEDTFADDAGTMRKKIAKKIKSMPRRMALEIIEKAVADGIISQTTADYLIREYVRSR